MFHPDVCRQGVESRPAERRLVSYMCPYHISQLFRVHDIVLYFRDAKTQFHVRGQSAQEVAMTNQWLKSAEVRIFYVILTADCLKPISAA
ncbi:hypothetical protein RRG08_005052 [Elysia crispata]|uniref:Uncharacterized protein n=1 Tax=Elysia crispata TaxID=231223 RepID=A0AAE0XYQ3_9GAST|nr:hypothetical protein RRG08_005052 [Elysia crispata]